MCRCASALSAVHLSALALHHWSNLAAWSLHSLAFSVHQWPCSPGRAAEAPAGAGLAAKAPLARASRAAVDIWMSRMGYLRGWGPGLSNAGRAPAVDPKICNAL